MCVSKKVFDTLSLKEKANAVVFSIEILKELNYIIVDVEGKIINKNSNNKNKLWK